MENPDIVILGAGITGLATASLLEEQGIKSVILEKKDQPGGSMNSVKEQDYLIDFGPNSGLDTTPLISHLAHKCGIQEEMVYANKNSATRYIVKHNRLMALPATPFSFFTTPIFSLGAKLRLFKEPFTGKSPGDGYNTSMADFVRHRLGTEFLDYAVNPFVSGIFAGNPEKLSVKSAFPRLYRLEEVYGGFIKGMFKGAKERKRNKEKSKHTAKMFSFLYGMQSFPAALAKSLQSKIEYNSKLINIKKDNGKYTVEYSVGDEVKTITCDILLTTIPAHILSSFMKDIDSELKQHLEEIYYPPVLQLYLGYSQEKIGRPLDGFGFLIPQKEKKSFLGAIWNSSIFPDRAPAKKVSFTVFVGGANNPEILKMDQKEILNKVFAEFSQLMNINDKPDFMKIKMWEKAIPQYNLGHIEHVRYFEKFEKENPGMFIGGNFRGGISVGDCIKSSEINAKKITEYYKNLSERG